MCRRDVALYTGSADHYQTGHRHSNGGAHPGAGPGERCRP